MKLARAKCPECGKVCAVRPPRGGDGSLDLYPMHLPPRGSHAEGSSYCLNSRGAVSPDEYEDDE